MRARETRCGLFSRERILPIIQCRFSSNEYTYVYVGCKNEIVAGRGCGGRIFNYGGRFTSPLYPNIYRNNTVCTWDVSVPRGLKIILQFLVFDIGTRKNCDNNNVKIYDVVPSGEVLHSTYCGGVSHKMLHFSEMKNFILELII